MAAEGSEERRALTILWRIQNFSYNEHGFVNAELETVPFHPCTLDGRECYLRLLPDDGSLVYKHLGSSFLYRGEELGYPIDFEWSFLDDDDSPLASGTTRNHPFRRNIPLTQPACPTHKEVFETRKSSFLPRDTLTVRFRIWKSDGEFPQAEHFSLLSRIEGSEHSLVCPIKRFSNLQLEESVTTTEDTVLGKGGVQLKFSLIGASLPDSMIHCQVIKSSKCQAPFMTVIKVSVLDNGQNAIQCGESTIEYWICNSSNVLVSRKELLEKKSEYLRGDVLSLLCEFTCIRSESAYSAIERTYLGPSNLKRELSRNDVIPVSKAICQTTQQSVEPTDASQERGDSLVTLGEDFLSLYREHALSDFELRSADVSLPVHKLVLSARSPVFKAMFSSDMKESESDSLEVPDVDTHSLNRMLTFLYAGTVVPLQWEAAGKLYYAADKYQVQSLKQQCSSFLRSGTTLSNVSDILTLADRHLDQGLTSFVHDFILQHYDEVMQTEEWEKFIENDSGLAGKTMHQLYKKKLQLKNH